MKDKCTRRKGLIIRIKKNKLQQAMQERKNELVASNERKEKTK